MYKGIFFRLSLFCILFLALEGCRSNPESQSKILKINLGSEPHSLDPRLARDASSLTLMRMFFEGLTRINPEDRPELALASKVEISKDLKTYVFTLRKSQWSNGDPVIASDFVSTWKKILSPNFPSDNAFQLFVLKNGKAVKDGTLSEDHLGVKALDENTLVIELQQPIPYFLELLAFPVFFPVNPKIDQTHPDWAQKEKNYVSNGPFSLKKWYHHDAIFAEKNPSYWDMEKVKLDGIELIMVSEDAEMKLFEKGELHWAGSPLSVLGLDILPMLKKNGKVHVKPIAGTSFLRVNVNCKALNNPKLRKSLALAIDRQSIAEHVLQGGGEPAFSLVPSILFTQNSSPQCVDNKTAAQLYREALEENGGEIPQVIMTYASSERAHLIAQAIQQQWKEVLGLNVILEGEEKKVYFDRISHQNYQLALGSWLADYNDPLNFLEVFKYKSRSTNNTNWEDQAYVQMLDNVNSLSNTEERLQLLHQCEKILMDALPVIPLFHSTMLYVKDENLNGVFLSSLGHLDFKWASMDNPE